MYQNVLQSPEGIMASIEVFTMLGGVFVLGFILAWLIKPKQSLTNFSKVSLAKELQDLEENGHKEEDDLQLIEWIGPSLEKMLHKYGVKKYKDILDEDVDGLEEILKQAWPRYSVHNPSTWPDQAKLALQKKWSELEEYQEIMINSWK